MLEMASRAAAAGARGHETLDEQVLHGLDSFLATERFLCKLEQARAEWIDLSEHAAAGCAHASAAPQHGGAAAAASARGHPLSGPFDGCDSVVLVHEGEDTPAPGAGAPQQPPPGAGAGADATSAEADGGAAPAEPTPAEHAAAAAAAAAVGDFVVIDKTDAVEAMAYYIALYISRLPEAQRMGPKELQSALRETFAILRRSKWRMVWSWGRVIYRSAAVSFSALQLYNNPWLLRAVLSAIWASSRLLYSQMV